MIAIKGQPSTLTAMKSHSSASVFHRILSLIRHKHSDDDPADKHSRHESWAQCPSSTTLERPEDTPDATQLWGSTATLKVTGTPGERKHRTNTPPVRGIPVDPPVRPPPRPATPETARGASGGNGGTTTNEPVPSSSGQTPAPGSSGGYVDGSHQSESGGGGGGGSGGGDSGGCGGGDDGDDFDDCDDCGDI